MPHSGARTDSRSALGAALSAVPRQLFLPEAWTGDVPERMALPIGGGEVTLPQEVIEKVFALADLRAGDRVLIVGAGYGYAPALAAALVGEQGRVTAYERNAALCEEATRRLAKAGILGAGVVRLVCGNGLAPGEEGKDDVILVFGELAGHPDALMRRLDFGGRMLYGQKGRLMEASRTRRGDIVYREHSHFTAPPIRE